MSSTGAREGSLIALARLDLVLFSEGCLEALVAGRHEEASRLLGAKVPSWWPDEHDLPFLRLRLEQGSREPGVRTWLVRGIVLREGRELVGHAGFHGPPGVNGPGRPRAVEIGYTVFSRFRGRGFATEAAAGLVRWAFDEGGVDAVLASVAPDNPASLAIVRTLGFEQIGEQWDEDDGLELVFARAT